MAEISALLALLGQNTKARQQMTGAAAFGQGLQNYGEGLGQFARMKQQEAENAQNRLNQQTLQNRSQRFEGEQGTEKRKADASEGMLDRQSRMTGQLLVAANDPNRTPQERAMLLKQYQNLIAAMGMPGMAPIPPPPPLTSYIGGSGPGAAGGAAASGGPGTPTGGMPTTDRFAIDQRTPADLDAGVKLSVSDKLKIAKALGENQAASEIAGGKGGLPRYFPLTKTPMPFDTATPDQRQRAEFDRDRTAGDLGFATPEEELRRGAASQKEQKAQKARVIAAIKGPIKKRVMSQRVIEDIAIRAVKSPNVYDPDARPDPGDIVGTAHALLASLIRDRGYLPDEAVKIVYEKLSKRPLGKAYIENNKAIVPTSLVSGFGHAKNLETGEIYAITGRSEVKKIGAKYGGTIIRRSKITGHLSDRLEENRQTLKGPTDLRNWYGGWRSTEEKEADYASGGGRAPGQMRVPLYFRPEGITRFQYGPPQLSEEVMLEIGRALAAQRDDTTGGR